MVFAKGLLRDFNIGDNGQILYADELLSIIYDSENQKKKDFVFMARKKFLPIDTPPEIVFYTMSVYFWRRK